VTPCFLIAEAGVNHNGSLENALRLVGIAAAAGVDAVKFQTFSAERLVTRGAATAAYQKERTGTADQFSMLRALELSAEDHRRLADRCAAKGIEFLSTPFDEEAADFLVSLGCRRMKIPSGEITNLPFLRHVAAKRLPVILSTGMSDLEEVRVAVDALVEAFGGGLSGDALVLLHCTSSYPAPLADVNLRAMRTLAEAFRRPVGYSDHTPGILVAPLARALGAVVIEKHFTLDRSQPGPDHAASLEPTELFEWVRRIREVDVVLGAPEKKPTEAELVMRRAARRSLVLAVDVSSGRPLAREHLSIRRPGTGLAPAALESTLGRCLKRDGKAGDVVRPDDLI
jgi:N,N'-diacetyllegionaminate synthase